MPSVCIDFAICVALLAEGVDRNLKDIAMWGTAMVALLAEGVDRNTYGYSM